MSTKTSPIYQPFSNLPIAGSHSPGKEPSRKVRPASQAAFQDKPLVSVPVGPFSSGSQFYETAVDFSGATRTIASFPGLESTAGPAETAAMGITAMIDLPVGIMLSKHAGEKQKFSASIGDEQGANFSRLDSWRFSLLAKGVGGLGVGRILTSIAESRGPLDAPISPLAPAATTLGKAGSYLMTAGLASLGLFYVFNAVKAGMHLKAIQDGLDQFEVIEFMDTDEEKLDELRKMIMVAPEEVSSDPEVLRKEAISTIANWMKESLDKLREAGEDVPKKSDEEYQAAAEKFLDSPDRQEQLINLVLQHDSSYDGRTDPGLALGRLIAHEKVRLRKEAQLERVMGSDGVKAFKAGLESGTPIDELLEQAVQAAREIRVQKGLDLLLAMIALISTILGFIFTAGVGNVIANAIYLSSSVMWIARELLAALAWYQANADSTSGDRVVIYFSIFLNVLSTVLVIIASQTAGAGPNTGYLLMGIGLPWFALNMIALGRINELDAGEKSHLNLDEFEQLLRADEKEGLKQDEAKLRAQEAFNKLIEADRQAILDAIHHRENRLGLSSMSEDRLGPYDYLQAMRHIQDAQSIKNREVLADLIALF